MVSAGRRWGHRRYNFRRPRAPEFASVRLSQETRTLPLETSGVGSPESTLRLVSRQVAAAILRQCRQLERVSLAPVLNYRTMCREVVRLKSDSFNFQALHNRQS